MNEKYYKWKSLLTNLMQSVILQNQSAVNNGKAQQETKGKQITLHCPFLISMIYFHDRAFEVIICVSGFYDDL